MSNQFWCAVPVDADTFKTALGHWGSGVTIITARGADGSPVGITASSFSSLSLSPPLVLFCVGRDSTNLAAFEAVEGFAIHILADGQDTLSNRFASRGADRFAGLTTTDGLHGAPVLPGCLAVLECRAHSRLPGGDHIIVVGEVEAVTLGEGTPLMYYRGGYRKFSDAG